MDEPEANAACGWNWKNFRHVRVPMSLLIAALVTQPLFTWLGAGYATGSPARMALMLAPMLLYSAVAVTLTWNLRKLDELLRHVHLQAATIGFVAALVAGFLLSGFAKAGVLHAAPGDGGAIGIFAWAIAMFRLSRRYRLGRWAPREP